MVSECSKDKCLLMEIPPQLSLHTYYDLLVFINYIPSSIGVFNLLCLKEVLSVPALVDDPNEGDNLMFFVLI